MTAGTRHRAGVVADEDAPVYERLRDAGAVLLGKLSMSEWAIGATNQNIHYGDVHNPWDTTRVSGGSSGGSGAAIGADLAAATLGTDTGGSVRIPAALNGCCGLRPTAGRVSNRGSIPVAWTFDTIGPLARRAEDVAAMLHVTAGYDHGDPVTADVPVGDPAGGLGLGVRGLRVGVLRGWQDTLDADLRARLEAPSSSWPRRPRSIASVCATARRSSPTTSCAACAGASRSPARTTATDASGSGPGGAACSTRCRAATCCSPRAPRGTRRRRRRASRWR
jgi:Asp-tRNA(Asn)/Glu-tRNA(Gln) amidotransferase A subunit family amidase